MKKKYVKIMFLSLSLLTISTTATYAVQPEDDKKENEALQTSTEEHLPLLTINGTNASSSFIVNSEALLGKEITITAPNGFTVTPTVIAANSGKQKVKDDDAFVPLIVSNGRCSSVEVCKASFSFLSSSG